MAEWPYNSARWKKLRLRHLSLNRLCIGCEARGRLRIANTVDHIKPISEGGPAFPGHDGLASYCPSCHSAKTARGKEAGVVKTAKPRKGCDANGNPLDAAHPWHTEESLRAAEGRPTGVTKTQLVPNPVRRRG
ncbi:HNH endonuclease signature motif containing protein [Blastomonas sp.]|uniref:HNH endonuclease signature motif containing protein n=1 Tax=Blastomonas sp. TaxID=1909299 RepID=UPI003592F2D4